MKFPQIIYVPAGTAAITIKITNTDGGGRVLFLDDFALIEDSFGDGGAAHEKD